MSNKNDFGVIIESEKDIKIFNFLLENVDRRMIEWAVNNLDGARKPYVSNVVKRLNIEVPDVDSLKNPGDVIPIEQGIDMLRQVMRIKKR